MSTKISALTFLLALAAAPLLAAGGEPPEPPSLLGPVTRAEVEQAEPDWVAAQAEAETDPESTAALAGVEPGATIQVYFGTWCSDSRRELARFWRALDENLGLVPFDVEYVAVDRSDQRPPELAEKLDLRFVPTFIVRREGREVGRVVEVSPNGIERDLLALLTGEAEGVVSAREDLGVESGPAAKIDRLIEQTVEEKNLVGLNAGVMVDGEVILAKGYGLRSLEDEEPVTPETLFAIGSVSKQFTCAAVFLLADDGQLSLDDPVARYMPELTRAADVTLLQLGQHVSGYRDYYPLDFVHRAMAQPAPSTEIIADFAGRPLDFEPGSRFSYSNTGYLILGQVVESVGGEPFGRFLERRILEPLGMSHTRYEPSPDEPGLATGYGSYALGDLEPATLEGRGWLATAGGIYSTPADLLAWDLALLDGKVLSGDSWRTMTTPATLADGRSTGYGCGLSAGTSNQALVLSHSGSVGGFKALNTIVPAHRAAIVLLANQEAVGATLGDLRDDILDELLPEEDEVPAVAGPSALEAAVAFLRQLRSGEVDRSELGEEFSAFLTPEKVEAASASLEALGEMKSAEVAGTYERGGMEVTVIRFQFGDEDLRANMFRTPDGRIQQLLISRP